MDADRFEPPRPLTPVQSPATGTLGASADDPQQIPPQSAHARMRRNCDERAIGEPSPSGRNGLGAPELRDETRPVLERQP